MCADGDIREGHELVNEDLLARLSGAEEGQRAAEEWACDVEDEINALRKEAADAKAKSNEQPVAAGITAPIALSVCLWSLSQSASLPWTVGTHVCVQSQHESSASEGVMSINCLQCGCRQPRSKFSSQQWQKGDGVARCEVVAS